MRTPPTADRIETLLPVLVYLSTHLERELKLTDLAAHVGMSPSHFQRLFKGCVGETPRQYVQRLRLERSAYHLKIGDASVLDVALDAGYRNHETFTRAFKRHFRMTPTAFRRTHRRVAEGLPWSASSAAREPLNRLASDYRLSAVTVQELGPLEVAFIRHLGPYVDADAGDFDTLIAWARRRGLYRDDALLLGIGHDDPGVTPAANLRFDACIEVPHEIEPRGRIGFQRLPGGLHATARYVGPYGPTLERALGELFSKLFALERYDVVGLPLIEVYRTTKINPRYRLNSTDIFVPVRRRPGA